MDIDKGRRAAQMAGKKGVQALDIKEIDFARERFQAAIEVLDAIEEGE